MNSSAIDVVERFNTAFNRHDVDSVMALMSVDCVFEGTAPPDGNRCCGADAVRAAWEQLFAATPGAHFTTEDLFAAADRVAVTWRYQWIEPGGGLGHVRGVDLFRVQHDGLICEKYSYVKG